MLYIQKQSGKVSDLVKKPLLMGVLNVTPDSFSDGGKYFDVHSAIDHAKSLIKRGFQIIDIGGESTRPGADSVSEEEEIKRVIPVIENIRRDVVRNVSTCIISIDTYKSNVAKAALETGAHMVNDVSGLTMDKNMVNVIRDFNCPVVIMHNDGIPAKKPTPEGGVCKPHLLKEIIQWLKKQTDYAVANGIKKENIIIDPGIGFGKTPANNLNIINNLSVFKELGLPVLVGPSRKSFIKKIFGENIDIELKTKELVELCFKNGADIVRVH